MPFAIENAVRSAMRRAVAHPRLRSTISRILLREDEIVPFGRALSFDPRTWVIKETEYGFRIWVALGERSISREIMLDRYERDEVAFVRSHVRPGDRVVDVGANIGFYTALLATLVGSTGQVLAFEPLSAVADALEHTVAENSFNERVRIHRVALDSQSGTIRLRHAPITINQGAAYIAPAASLPPGHIDEEVAASTLDEIVADGRCTFIKLDAEGAEPRILAGARETLLRCRPILLTEINPALLDRVCGQRANDVLDYMASLGYEARLIPHGSEIVERYEGNSSINVSFTPVDYSPLVSQGC